MLEFHFVVSLSGHWKRTEATGTSRFLWYWNSVTRTL